jgi:hypothetical protein
LVIRRSRLDLIKVSTYKDDLEKQNLGFADTGDPEALVYELGEISDLYLSTLQLISPDMDNSEIGEHYQAARYKAVDYLKPVYEERFIEKVEAAGFDYGLFIGSQLNLSKFMRRMLVQRFESSKKAFEISLGRMIVNTKNILNWIEKRGKVPILKKGNLPNIENYYRGVTSSDELFGEEYEEATFEDELNKSKYQDLFELETEYFDDAFVTAIKNDIAILEDIKENWFGIGKNIPDPKRDHFAEIVQAELKKDKDRKIVIFSSYADTIDDLYEKLKETNLKVFKYTAKDASTKNKETIKKNFDAGIRDDLKEHDYDVLVATDAISEGYNLHRAGTIINYDIPYNPTRVIQRVGRINRINKKMFDRLYIYNYFPTSIGEGETRTKEISTLKLAMINAIIGEDTKVLTSDIELRSFFALQYKNMLAETEAEGWETKYREIWETAKGTKEFETALAIPHRSKIGRAIEKSRNGVLLFGRKKDVCVFKMSSGLLDTDILNAEDAFNLLEADILEQPKSVSKNFDAIYQNLKLALFKSIESSQKDKGKTDVLDRLQIIGNSNVLLAEYDGAAALIDTLLNEIN